LADTPPENQERRQELQQQLGRILLEKGPYGEAGQVLAQAIEALEPADRGPLVKAVLARAEVLVRTDKPEQALELIDAFRAARTNWPAAEQAEAFDQLQGEAVKAAVARAIANLSGSDEQVQTAMAALKKIGRPAAGGLLEALESAAREGRAAVERRILAALEAVTGRTDHGYDPAAPLENRLKAIAKWRKTLAASSAKRDFPEAVARPPETQPPPPKSP
jgi:tetratricopeptide (TPR) repeat protein